MAAAGRCPAAALFQGMGPVVKLLGGTVGQFTISRSAFTVNSRSMVKLKFRKNAAACERTKEEPWTSHNRFASS